MTPDQTPFPTAWPFTELKGYRDHPHPATYSRFPYESLPPLPDEMFQGDFRWLAAQPIRWSPGDRPLYKWEKHREGLIQQAGQKLSVLRRSAADRGLVIPPEFITFMENPELIHRIRSVTDCYFEPSQRLANSPREDGGIFIHFLSDQQGCVFWNLYLSRAGGHCVVASEEYFGDDDFDAGDEDDLEDLHFCAPSFEAFIYRFWIENEIWFAINKPKARWWAPWQKTDLSAAQKRYVGHYRGSV